MRQRLRHSVRGLLVDEQDHLLLYRFTVRGEVVVWTAPGGGVECGESLLQALQRELDEEVGLRLPDDLVHVWHQEVLDSGLLAGYDGVINDYYLIRTPRFTPCGSLGDVELAREQVGDFEWWSVNRLLRHDGQAVFGPRNLPSLMSELINGEVPMDPMAIGL